MIDEEVRAIIDRAYDRATEVLTTHRDRLDRLAEKLIAEETVDQPEFEKLFDDLPPKPERTAGIPRVDRPRHRRRDHDRPDGPGPEPVAPARLTPGARTDDSHDGRTTRSARRFGPSGPVAAPG